MTRVLSVMTVLSLSGIGFAADPPKVSDLALEDQFEAKNSVADHKGKVLILVYGDRSGLEASRELGTQLHVLFHPTAEGKTAKEAKAAPVVALDGVAKGTASPDVAVVPVACCGKVPGAVQGFIRGALKKDAADTPVWMDFANVMKDKFGLTEGEPNLVVIDALGRLRLKVNGKPDKETLQKVLQTTQNLRAEAAGLR
jgi:predicted transcriptional regulator